MTEPSTQHEHFGDPGNDQETAGIDYYRDGLRYVDGLIEALRSARYGQFATASAQAHVTDCILAPLGEEDDPEEFRSFIAGAAFAAEHYLRQAGVHIVADGPTRTPLLDH